MNLDIQSFVMLIFSRLSDSNGKESNKMFVSNQTGGTRRLPTPDLNRSCLDLEVYEEPIFQLTHSALSRYQIQYTRNDHSSHLIMLSVMEKRGAQRQIKKPKAQEHSD